MVRQLMKFVFLWNHKAQGSQLFPIGLPALRRSSSVALGWQNVVPNTYLTPVILQWLHVYMLYIYRYVHKKKKTYSWYPWKSPDDQITPDGQTICWRQENPFKRLQMSGHQTGKVSMLAASCPTSGSRPSSHKVLEDVGLVTGKGYWAPDIALTVEPVIDVLPSNNIVTGMGILL